jgi:hypothetical protein
MHVHVHLFGSFSRYSPTGSDKFQIEIENPDSVESLLERIGFPSDVERMVVVNGSQSGSSTPVRDGDDIFIYYPAAGG